MSMFNMSLNKLCKTVGVAVKFYFENPTFDVLEKEPQRLSNPIVDIIWNSSLISILIKLV